MATENYFQNGYNKNKLYIMYSNNILHIVIVLTHGGVSI